MFFLNYNKECKKSALCYFLKLMLKGGARLFFFPTWKKLFAGREEK